MEKDIQITELEWIKEEAHRLITICKAYALVMDPTPAEDVQEAQKHLSQAAILFSMASDAINQNA